MGLLSRLTTLAKADAHGVVDAIEDRALTLRQHLRDAHAELDAKRGRRAAMVAERNDLQREDDRLEQQVGALEEDIALALQNDKEELARFAIKKQLPLRRARQRIALRRRELDEQQRHLDDQLADQEQAFADLEQRVKAHLAQHERSGGDHVAVDWRVSEEDVELELLRRQRDQAGGGAS